MHLIIMLLIVSASQRIESCHRACVSAAAEGVEEEQKTRRSFFLAKGKILVCCSIQGCHLACNLEGLAKELMCGEVSRSVFLLRLKDRAGLLLYSVVNKSSIVLIQLVPRCRRPPLLPVSIIRCTF